MSQTIEFYFDFRSPYSYLAHTQLPALAARFGALVTYKPIDVLEVMARVGNSPTTVLCAAKARYAQADLARWAQAYGVPLQPNPHNRAIAPRPLLLGAIAAARVGCAEAYVQAVFEGVWMRQAAFADDAETLSVLRQGGCDDGEAVLAGRDEAADDLAASIEAAVAAGVFGTPSFMVGETLFFGNDRLNFLAEELGR